MYHGAVVKRILGTNSVIIPGYRVLSNMRFASKKTPTTSDCDKPKEDKEISHTTVILQDRLDIQEVPTIVRRVQTSDFLTDNLKTKQKGSEELTKKYEVAEEQEIIDGLQRCHTLKSVHALVDVLPKNELTPRVSVHAIKRIIDLENNSVYRNQIRHLEHSKENIRRTWLLNKLISTIKMSSQSDILIESLRVLSRDTVGKSNADYKENFLNEVVIRASEKNFSVNDMCEIIKLLALFDFALKEEYIDKMWVGIIDRGREINETNISEVFQILPIFNQSRKMIFNLLERKMYDLWWRIPSSTIVEIMSSLNEAKFSSPRTLGMLARNTCTNIHLLSEDHMLKIVTCLSVSDYLDDNVEIFLEKYVKTRGAKVKNCALMTAVMEYCAKFRVRNEVILQSCADFLIQNGKSFSPALFRSFFVPFGLLNYRPKDAKKFWQVVENLLDEKFVQYRPDDIVEMVLACVYLEKFPINLTTKVLNPYFLDKLHSCKAGHELQELRTKLKIYDSAMTLECNQYEGPMLPREYVAKHIFQDGRVKRMIHDLYDIMADIAGSCERISTTVLLPQLPSANLYLIDILFHPAGMGASMHQFDFTKDRDLYLAILIHLEKDFCDKEKELLGPQAMKKRHIKKLGLSVVDLKYSELVKLRKSPVDMQQYVLDKIEEMELSV